MDAFPSASTARSMCARHPRRIAAYAARCAPSAFVCLLPVLLCVVQGAAGERLTWQWYRVAIAGGLVGELSLPSAQRLRCACNHVVGSWRRDAVHFYYGDQWQFERNWNGDQTDYGVNFSDLPQVLKIKLATY
ncbi:DUF5597 domain-containing protein [Xanthomonas graminis]|uniref:DUF5597 domain-containing protein n=2 Tax=Xanthomonas graminis TaxID=3390026 RepID=UPI001112D5AA